MLRKRKSMLALGMIVFATVASLAASPVLAAPKKKLTIWLPNSYIWNLMCDKFRKSHPNVDLVQVDGTIDKFYTMITAGMMPDVWGPWGTPGITADVNRNWALDLGPYIKRDSKEMDINDFFPGLMRQFRVRGKQYSLPIFSYTDWYFYNTDSYAKAGLRPPPLDAKDKSWNWEQMVANAQKMTRRSADGNRLLEPGLEFSRDLNCTPNWLRLWGVKLYSDEALKSSIPQDIDLNSPRFVKALTEMWNLIYKQRVVSPGFQGFSGAKTGSSIEHGWSVFYYMNVKKLKWAIAPLPWAVTDSGTLWPDGFRIARISKNKDLAWEFVKFMCSPESMSTIVTDPKSDRRGSAVARKSVFAETLGREVGKATGMRPQDVFKVHEQADEVGIVKESETICLHVDLSVQYIEPILTEFWAGKYAPAQASQKMDETGRKGMAILFKRWVRNVKYTGAQL